MNQKHLNILAEAKNPLVLAVGGGNDSVSTLLIQKQLQKTFNYFPEKISVVAMLPDCLDYTKTEDTEHPLVKIITEDSQRSVQGKLMSAFPERILSQNKKVIPTLKVSEVYGLLMTSGSIGIANALEYLISRENYDLILAMDVGGDFIAVPENIEVLSPMMDAYMMYALKHLNSHNETFKNIPIIYGVFGLGTDGESTPELLRKALSKVDFYEGEFHANDVADVISFYRNVVEPNRYSRTTDFTMREIVGLGHDNPAQFRGRFHVKTSLDKSSQVNYGVFQHTQDKAFYSKYYLFNDISQVNNPFAIACSNGLEWFLNIQNQTTKINHELNGQSYNLKNIGLNDSILFFGTPSRKFNHIQQQEIASQINLAMKNGVYDLALVYDEQKENFEGLIQVKVTDDLLLIGKNMSLINEVVLAAQNYLHQ